MKTDSYHLIYVKFYSVLFPDSKGECVIVLYR